MLQSEGNTISQLNLAIEELDRTKPEAFANALRAALVKLKNDRLDWYLGRMRSRSSLVNRLPMIGAVLGVAGVLFSGGAALARALSIADISPWKMLDVVMMALAGLAYTLMSAAVLYERLTEGSGGYFRAATTVVAIRDLWSQYRFGDISRSLAVPDGDRDKEIQRWLDPARDFCKALDAIVAAEMTEWKTAYLATAKMRSDVADEGLKSAIAELKQSADAAAQSAKEAASKADEAAKAAGAAQASATLDVTLGVAGVVGHAVVTIDGKERQGTNQTSFSIPGLRQGVHVVHVDFTPSDAGKAKVSFEKSVDLKNGINAEAIKLL